MRYVVEILVRAVVIAAASTTALAESVPERRAAPGTAPLTFGKSIRSPERLAPAPPYAALSSQLFGRQVVQMNSPDKAYSVQVWALLVSANARTGEAKLTGATVLLVQTGEVNLDLAGEKVHLRPGDTAAVREGGTFRFENENDQPAHIRAVVLSAAH